MSDQWDQYGGTRSRLKFREAAPPRRPVSGNRKIWLKWLWGLMFSTVAANFETVENCKTRNKKCKMFKQGLTDGRTDRQPDSSNYFIRSTIQDDFENRSASALTSKRRNNVQLVVDIDFTSLLWFWTLTYDWPTSIESFWHHCRVFLAKPCIRNTNTNC